MDKRLQRVKTMASSRLAPPAHAAWRIHLSLHSLRACQHETERPTGIRQRHNERPVFGRALMVWSGSPSMRLCRLAMLSSAPINGRVVNLMAKHPLGVHSVVATATLQTNSSIMPDLPNTALCSKPRNAHG